MKILDGKAVAGQIHSEIAEAIDRLEGRRPGLAVVIVGSHGPSVSYVSLKRRHAQQVGIHSVVHELPESVSEDELLSLIHTLNHDRSIDGILVQLPLPKHISSQKVMRRIDPSKDVDGFHPVNVGRLLIGDDDGFLPCTPLGIRELLGRYQIDISGKHVVILGRSNIVGKPMAGMLIQDCPGGNATVTVVHSKSQNVEAIAKQADILIVAIGKAAFVGPSMVKEGAIVIDVGINRVDAPEHPNGYIVKGDVDFEQVKDRCRYITPVPGGVGPMTVAMLLSNTWTAYLRHEGLHTF